jgi:ATP-dependent Clp protease ATP-binding subunit ClpB
VHHGVRIQDAALVAAAVLSDRYITGRFLPDKAIDLVDEAASGLRIEKESKPTEIDVVDRRMAQLEIERLALAKETDPASKERLAKIDEELANLREQSAALNTRWHNEKEASDAIGALQQELESSRGEAERFTRDGDLAKAAEIQYGQIPELERRLNEAIARLAELQADQKMLKQEVDSEDVAEVVSKWTGVPVSRLLEGEVPSWCAWRTSSISASSARTRRSPRWPTPSAAPAAACPIPTGRSAASCSSARPVSARPSWPGPWPSSSSTTSGPWCASTCRSTWRSTRCPASSAPPRATSAMTRAASSPRRSGADPTGWCCSTRSRRPTRTCSTSCCKCSTTGASPTGRGGPSTSATRS